MVVVQKQHLRRRAVSILYELYIAGALDSFQRPTGLKQAKSFWPKRGQSMEINRCTGGAGGRWSSCLRRPPPPPQGSGDGDRTDPPKRALQLPGPVVGRGGRG